MIPGPKPLVLSALRIEARAVGGSVTVTGMGQRRARERAATLAPTLAGDQPVAIAGVAGALDADLRPGDLVVASELRTVDGEIVRRLPGADLLAAELLRAGCRVRIGPVVSSSSLVRSPGARRALAGTGALCVDMESAFIARSWPSNQWPWCGQSPTRPTSASSMVGIPSAAGTARSPGTVDPWVGRSGHARSSWQLPAPFAPGWTGPSRLWSAPWSGSACRCTSGARSCTTRTSYAGWRRWVPSSSSSWARCPTVQLSCSPPTACPPRCGPRLRLAGLSP